MWLSNYNITNVQSGYDQLMGLLSSLLSRITPPLDMSLMGIISGLIAPRVMIVLEHGVNGQTTSVLDTGISLNSLNFISNLALFWLTVNKMC